MGSTPMLWRNTIDDAFRRCARRWRSRLAVRYRDREWSFDDLDRAISGIAEALSARGLAKGDPVAAYGRNSDTYLLLWLACARAGSVHIPVNFGLTGEELRFIVAQSGARAVLADAAMESELSVLDGSKEAGSRAAATSTCWLPHAPERPIRDARGTCRTTTSRRSSSPPERRACRKARPCLTGR